MKTRIEAFIERLALGSDIQGCAHDDDSLGEISRMLNECGQSALARKVYALYTEAFLIQREMEHQREQTGLKELPPGTYSCNADFDEQGRVTRIFNVQPAKS